VHRIIGLLRGLKPALQAPSRLQIYPLWIREKHRDVAATKAIYHLEERDSRDFLLFLFSLLIHSPSNRSKYENFPARLGLPVNENIGKVNVRQNCVIAKICASRAYCLSASLSFCIPTISTSSAAAGQYDRLSGSSGERGRWQRACSADARSVRLCLHAYINAI
jgi:hypothetical protein